MYYPKARKLDPSKYLSQILHILPITLVNSSQDSQNLLRFLVYEEGTFFNTFKFGPCEPGIGHFFWDDFVDSISIANLCSVKVLWRSWLNKHFSRKWHFKMLVVQSIFQLYTGKMKDRFIEFIQKTTLLWKIKGFSKSFWIQGWRESVRDVI